MAIKTAQQILNDVLTDEGLAGVVDTVQQAFNIVHDPVNHAMRVKLIGGGASGHTIQDDSVNLPNRKNLNFIGGVEVVDDPGDDSTTVNITGTGEGMSIHGNTYHNPEMLASTAMLAEFDTEPKKATARTNLGLETIDGGIF